MILSDRSIKQSIAEGRIVITPYDETLVQPASIDIRLDGRFLVFRNYKYSCIDPKALQQDLTELIEVADDEPFIVHPGEFILGNTVERVKLGDDIVARLEGKALALDTPIPTPSGWKTMGDLRVGDWVFHPGGCPVPVVAATEVMLGRPCFRVSFFGGESIIADSLHQWSVCTKARRSHGSTKSPVVYTTEQISQKLRYGKEWNYHIALCQPVCYPEQVLPIDPYVLGVWLGDGTSTQAVLSCADPQIWEEVMRAGYEVAKLPRPLQYRLGGCGHTRNPANGQYCRNASLSSTLRTMNLLGNKHVPKEYLQASIAQRLALLQGLMDSDGFSDEYGRCEFCNMRPELANAVMELAASLGFRPCLSTKTARLYGKDCGTAYRVKFTPNRPVFRLERKRIRQVMKQWSHQFRAITAVEPVDSLPVRCIQVGSSDGLYLAGQQFITTHNSSLGRLGLIVHATAGYVDPGFEGNITLELSNVANLPIRLYPGMKVGQISFFAMSTPADRPYGHPGLGSKYKGQTAPTASRMHLNFPNQNFPAEGDKR